MSLAESASELVQSIIDIPGEFAAVAAHDPVSAVLLALGALLTALPVLVLGYLTLGAAVSIFTVEAAPRQPPEAR